MSHWNDRHRKNKFGYCPGQVFKRRAGVRGQHADAWGSFCADKQDEVVWRYTRASVLKVQHPRASGHSKVHDGCSWSHQRHLKSGKSSSDWGRQSFLPQTDFQRKLNVRESRRRRLDEKSQIRGSLDRGRLIRVRWQRKSKKAKTVKWLCRESWYA